MDLDLEFDRYGMLPNFLEYAMSQNMPHEDMLEMAKLYVQLQSALEHVVDPITNTYFGTRTIPGLLERINELEAKHDLRGDKPLIGEPEHLKYYEGMQRMIDLIESGQSVIYVVGKPAIGKSELLVELVEKYQGILSDVSVDDDGKILNQGDSQNVFAACYIGRAELERHPGTVVTLVDDNERWVQRFMKHRLYNRYDTPRFRDEDLIIKGYRPLDFQKIKSDMIIDVNGKTD